MTKKTDQERIEGALPRGMRIRILFLRILAGLFLSWERIIVHLWPAFIWTSLFFSLWLFQIPEILGRWAEILCAIFFPAGIYFLFHRIRGHIVLPHGDEIIHRIETDSGLRHRPLTGLGDRLAFAGEDRTRGLWRAWRRHLMPALMSMRWPKLHPVLAPLDPYALRGLAVIFLAVSLWVSGPAWTGRIAHGLFPVQISLPKPSLDKTVIWITPPEYTGMGQIVLKGRGDKKQTITIPEGSIIKARITGGFGIPEILIGQESYPLENLGKNSYGIETPAQDTKILSIRQMFFPRASWNISFIPDMPPALILDGDPKSDPNGEFKVPLTVRDDYSVESVATTITLDPSVENPPALGTDFTETRSVMSAPKTDLKLNPVFDLSWHPWAGMPVIITIEGTDHKGQVTKTDPVKITLPERDFRHPVAKKLAEFRTRLIWTPESAAKNIAHDVETIMTQPDLWHGDILTFLALRTAASRLYYNQTPENVARVVELLWDTALHIEDGNFSMAQRNLRQAQLALQNALKNPNATPDEIARLMDELRMAMAEYMREMFREMQKRMAESGKQPIMMTPDTVMKNIRPQDLAAFLDKMQAEALTGNRDTAREMLSEMNRFMQMFDPDNMQMSMPQDVQQMMESIQGLQEILERQQALLEQTEREAGLVGQEQTYGQPLVPDIDLLKKWGLDDLPPQPQENRIGNQAPKHPMDTGDEKSEQDALLTMLGDIMVRTEEKLGQVPGVMKEAEQEMGKSSAQLEENSLSGSIPHQERVIELLSQSQQQMSQQLAQRMQEMMMFSFGMSGPTDPLGRPMGENGTGLPWGTKIEIPDEGARRRVQDIMDELRKKSGELMRPDYELDYYRRLLRQF